MGRCLPPWLQIATRGRHPTPGSAKRGLRLPSPEPGHRYIEQQVAIRAGSVYQTTLRHPDWSRLPFLQSLRWAAGASEAVWSWSGTTAFDPPPAILSLIHPDGTTQSFEDVDGPAGHFTIAGLKPNHSYPFRLSFPNGNSGTHPPQVSGTLHTAAVDPTQPPSARAALEWWLSHFRLTDEHASQDLDGDGYTTTEEYWTGTNPTHSDSHLRVQFQTVDHRESEITLQIDPFLEGRRYQLYERSHIGPGSTHWRLVQEATRTDSPDATFIRPRREQAYYQLRITPPPSP